MNFLVKGTICFNPSIGRWDKRLDDEFWICQDWRAGQYFRLDWKLRPFVLDPRGKDHRILRTYVSKYYVFGVRYLTPVGCPYLFVHSTSRSLPNVRFTSLVGLCEYSFPFFTFKY